MTEGKSRSIKHTSNPFHIMTDRSSLSWELSVQWHDSGGWWLASHLVMSWFNRNGQKCQNHCIKMGDNENTWWRFPYTETESCTVHLDWHDCNIHQMSASSHMQHSSANSYFLIHVTFLTKHLLPHTCNIPHQTAASSHMQHSSANSYFLTYATFLSK